MKVLLTGGKEPVAEKAVWDVLAFMHASFMPVTLLELDGDTPITGYGASWAGALKIPTAKRGEVKGKPAVLLAFNPDETNRPLISKAHAAGVRIYEMNNV